MPNLWNMTNPCSWWNRIDGSATSGQADDLPESVIP